MTKVTTVQAAHTYGVLDPHMIERRDTKFVGGSLSDGRNIIIMPQGGYTDRGGSTDLGRVRRQLNGRPVTAGMVTMPNGGSAAAIIDGSADQTITVTGSNRSVLFEVDFGAPTIVHFIDIARISVAGQGAGGALIAEYWNGSVWLPFGGALLLTTSRRSRRFASGQPGHVGHTANRFRVSIDGTIATGPANLGAIAFWAETTTASDGICRRYSTDANGNYRFIITDRNVDVYEGMSWRAAIALPAAEAIVRHLKLEPRFDTVLVWHVDLMPQRIERMGSAGEWSCAPAVFENIPLVDYGGTYTNGVTEVQQIELYEVPVGGTFDLTAEGQSTTAILRDTTQAATAANIKAALEALPNVSPGLTVTAIADTVFDVLFSGAGNANRDWLTMVGTALTGDSYVRVRTLVEGRKGGEPIMSSTRGWPAVGRFAQQRLIMAGLKSRPNEMVCSVSGDPYDLNTELGSAISAFVYEIDGMEDNRIRDIILSRVLIFPGSERTAYLRNNTLSASEAPQFGQSDAPGIKAGTPAVSSDNAIFYIQEGGQTLRQMSYTEIEQNYQAENASVLSAHLIRDPVDMVRRRATGAVDSDLIIMANGDGTATAFTVMRSQEVSGFAPWETDGQYVSFCVDHQNVLWALVRRLDTGTLTLRQERMDPDKLLDEAVEFTYAEPTTTIGSIARFNGRTVWVIGNESVYGPFEVSAGSLELPEAVTAARVGTWIAPLATDPDVSLEEETRSRHARLKRVNRAVISILETTSLAIRVNDGETVSLPLRTNDDTFLDEGPLARPVSGRIEAEGMHGFTDHGRLTVTQEFPGALTVRSVTKNIVA